MKLSERSLTVTTVLMVLLAIVAPLGMIVLGWQLGVNVADQPILFVLGGVAGIAMLAVKLYRRRTAPSRSERD